MEWTLYFEISSSVFILCTFAFATGGGGRTCGSCGTGVLKWTLLDPNKFQTIFQRGSLFLKFSLEI